MDITPKPITVTQAMTNPEKLMMLRTELFNAVQKLEGDELAEFWKIMDDLNSMRQSVVSGNQDLDIDSNTRMISITAPRMGDVVFLVSYGERFAYQKIDRSFFQDAVQAGIMAKVMLEQLDAYMEKMQVEQEAERMEEEGK
jgi:hypothetical protein